MSWSAAASHAPSAPATKLAALLVAVWLAAAAQLLWHFEKQRVAQLHRLAHFAVDDLPSAPATAAAGVAKVLYFLDRTCRCNAAAVAEIDRLRRAGQLPAAQFAVDAQSAADSGGADVLSVDERAAWRDRVPPTPAVALWDAHGKLVYFGPIRANAGCGDGVSYLHNALRTMRTDSSAPFSSWDVVTCACPAAQSFHS